MGDTSVKNSLARKLETSQYNTTKLSQPRQPSRIETRHVKKLPITGAKGRFSQYNRCVHALCVSVCPFFFSSADCPSVPCETLSFFFSSADCPSVPCETEPCFLFSPLKRYLAFLYRGRDSPRGSLSVLTLIRCPSDPRVTAVAHKRLQSFCQKCPWQVTPKHACTFDPTQSYWAFRIGSG